MGFLSSIAKIGGVLAAPFTGGTSLIATGLDVAGDFLSTKMANDAASKAATVGWGRTMDASNTSYQRGVADMRAAGLNPILAYSQGGASTPTAQVAATRGPSLGSTGSKAVANATQVAQTENVKANTVNTMQNTQLSNAQEALAQQQSMKEALNNEGLRSIPPQWRALAQMEGNTGLGLAAGKTFGKGAGAIFKKLKGIKK